MARIDDLMSEISEATLKARLQREIAELKKDKKFGLVFERHLPELAPARPCGAIFSTPRTTLRRKLGISASLWSQAYQGMGRDRAVLALAIVSTDAGIQQSNVRPLRSCGLLHMWPGHVLAQAISAYLTPMHASFRFSLAAAATHPPPELLIPPAGPVGDRTAFV